MFLVLCGSLVAFMKDEVLAESAPLYGRSDLEMKLRPFNYYETALFVENYSNEEKAIVYGLTGGVAKYIRQFDDRIPLDENIIEQFFYGRIFYRRTSKNCDYGRKAKPSIIQFHNIGNC